MPFGTGLRADIEAISSCTCWWPGLQWQPSASPRAFRWWRPGDWKMLPISGNPKVLKWGWVKTYYYHICGNQHPLASYFRYRLGPRVLTHSQVLKSPWNPHLSYDLYLDVPYMDPVVPSKYDWGMVWLWLWCTFSDSVYGSIGVITPADTLWVGQDARGLAVGAGSFWSYKAIWRFPWWDPQIIQVMDDHDWV